MSSPLPAIRRTTRDIVDDLHRASQILPELGMIELADGIRMFLDGPSPFEQALGLDVCWRETLRRASRDQALRHLAQTYFAGMAGLRLARAVSQAGRLYEASTWRHDRRARRRPDGLRGSLYDVLSYGGSMPGKARLRQIFNELPC